MAKIQHNEQYAGFGIGTTWGTADDLTAGTAEAFRYRSISWNDSFQFLDVKNTSNTNIDQHKLALTSQFQTVHELEYHSCVLKMIALFFGTSTASPSEQNVGEGDYLHQIDVANSIRGKFGTIAYCVEDDQVIERPSCKPSALTLLFEANQPVVATIDWVADRYLYSGSDTPANTQAEVAALTAATTEEAVVGGSGLYLRVNAESGGALSSSDDHEVVRATFRLERGYQNKYVFQGANTPYIVEPYESTAWASTLDVEYAHVDDADHDPLGDVTDQTARKAELQITGNQIGSGDNATLKLMLPSMKGRSTQGYGPQRGQILAPSASYMCFGGVTAPTGMTGVTKPRLEATSTISAGLLT